MRDADNQIYRIYHRCRDALVRALVRLSVQPEDVDDILQETLARAVEANRKKALDLPKSYLFAVSRNMVFRDQQRRSREVQMEIDEAVLEADESPIDEEVHYRKMLDAFWAALDTLPPSHRRAILLRRLYGLSHQQIAEKMGVSLSSVEKYFAQGIKRCQDILARQGYGVGEDRVVVRKPAAPNASARPEAFQPKKGQSDDR